MSRVQHFYERIETNSSIESCDDVGDHVGQCIFCSSHIVIGSVHITPQTKYLHCYYCCLLINSIVQNEYQKNQYWSTYSPVYNLLLSPTASSVIHSRSKLWCLWGGILRSSLVTWACTYDNDKNLSFNLTTSFMYVSKVCNYGFVVNALSPNQWEPFCLLVALKHTEFNWRHLSSHWFILQSR